jgi:hypothetical protein
MVKKIKKKDKLGKVKFNWKVIVAIIGVILMIILLMYIIGQAGLQTGR